MLLQKENSWLTKSKVSKVKFIYFYQLHLWSPFFGILNDVLRMRILQLCKKFPYPPNDGESIAINHLTGAMKALGAQTTLLSLNTSKHFVDLKSIPEGFDLYEKIYTVDIDNRIHLLDAFINLFSSKSYHITRFITREFEEKLAQILTTTSFDVVQLESLYLAPYISTIKKYSQAAIVMRAHNVEFEIWQRISQTTHFFLKRWYISHLTKKLKGFELSMFPNYDLLVAITDRDKDIFQQLGYKGEIMTIPVGLDMERYNPDFDTFPFEKRISFIGSLDWLPNIEGLKWFLSNVWPLIQQECEDATFHIAGRNAPDWLRHINAKGVCFWGEIDCASTFLKSCPITVVPLFSGSGMRVKIIESMALGRAVVTTALGLEGINARHDEEVMITENEREMADIILMLLRDNRKAKQIGHKAHSFINDQFDNLALGKKLLNSYKSYFC